MEREIATNQMVIPTYYMRNENGTITYDLEMIREVFENELNKLKK